MSKFKTGLAIVLCVILLLVVCALVVSRRFSEFEGSGDAGARGVSNNPALGGQAGSEEKNSDAREADIRIDILRNESGEIIVMADGRTFGIAENDSGEKIPDFMALEDYLSRKKQESEAGEEPGLTVAVHLAAGIDFKHALFALKACEQAGLTQIRFEAAPDALDACFEENDEAQEAPKQK
jgi:hypothetical protein